MLIDAATRQLHYTVVYYGPHRSGKTTNLQFIQQRAMPHEPNALRSWPDQHGRTAFFDQLSLAFGVQRGLHTTLHLLAVPGADMYAHTRTALLANADGIVFVADARSTAQAANQASWHELQEALDAYALRTVPIVVQGNHQDAADALNIQALHALFVNVPAIMSASAITGTGVLATLQTISHKLLATL
jgi:hypothetical protein